MRSTCIWQYRQGNNKSHFAMTLCKKGFSALTRIPNSEPYVGVADFYNGKLCPICGGIIEMKYDSISQRRSSHENKRHID